MPGKPNPVYDNQRSQMIVLVDQLRIHYKMDRHKMSHTVKDMIDYCQQNMDSDPFIYPVKDNPFKEKKSCNLL